MIIDQKKIEREGRGRKKRALKQTETMDDLKVDELIVSFINTDDKEETSITLIDNSLIVSPFNKVAHRVRAVSYCIPNFARNTLTLTLRTWSIPFAQPDLALPVHQQEEMNLSYSFQTHTMYTTHE